MLHTFTINLHKTPDCIYFGLIKKKTVKVYIQIIYPVRLYLWYFTSSFISRLTSKKQGKYVRLNSKWSPGIGAARL